MVDPEQYIVAQALGFISWLKLNNITHSARWNLIWKICLCLWVAIGHFIHSREKYSNVLYCTSDFRTQMDRSSTFNLFSGQVRCRMLNSRKESQQGAPARAAVCRWRQKVISPTLVFHSAGVSFLVYFISLVPCLTRMVERWVSFVKGDVEHSYCW
jgi:hypothetical protein